jgi:uncharacterized protein (TIGR02996 family)
MLSDRDALLAAICANPHEDTPRLAFADWLNENGEDARAEFIRAQCALAQAEDEHDRSYAMYEFLCRVYPTGLAATNWERVDPGVKRLIDLHARCGKLLKKHGAKWRPQGPGQRRVKWAGFRRGFPHLIELRSEREFGTFVAGLRGTVPPVELAVHDALSRVLDLFDEPGSLDWLAAVSTSEPVGVRELGHRPEARNISALRIGNPGDGEPSIPSALGAPYWTGLRSLHLSDGLVSREAAEALLRLPNLRTLRHLRLRAYDGWIADPVRTLAVDGFTELRTLGIEACYLNDDAAEALANCADLKNLRYLELRDNRITGRGVTALLTSPHLTNLVYLGLERNPCAGVDAKNLAKAPPGALRLLHAHGARFEAADVGALMRCPRVRTCWYFDVDDNNLGTPAVRALVRGGKDWCPPILWIAYNSIDDKGAEALANWRAASNLSALHIKYNSVTDAGVSALLDSPHLAKLDALGADATAPETAARLAARFKHPAGY